VVIRVSDTGIASLHELVVRTSFSLITLIRNMRAPAWVRAVAALIEFHGGTLVLTATSGSALPKSFALADHSTAPRNRQSPAPARDRHSGLMTILKASILLPPLPTGLLNRHAAIR
jgi:hypothetical protein